MYQIEIYADESGSLQQTMQSVCLIAGSNRTLNVLNHELFHYKEQFDIDELKTTKIRNTKEYYSCALGWLKILLSYALMGQIRIRAQASSHANQYSQEKRYLKGLHEINNSYSGGYNDIVYRILPDENNAFNWDRHSKYWSNFLPITEVRQVKSDQELLVQASDLISGLLRVGLQEYETYRNQDLHTKNHNGGLNAKFSLLKLLEKGSSHGDATRTSQQIGFLI